jgi:Tol biopolymer transport system component
MSDELLAANEGPAASEQTPPSASRPAYVLPSLILAVLAVVVIGGYLLYQRSNGSLGLGFTRPNRIAFMSDRDGNWEIYVMDRDGSNLVNLTNSPGADGIPIYASGLGRLAFASDRDGPTMDIYLMDLDGGNVVNLTNTPDSNEIPIAWSPNGEYLAFAGDQGGSTGIFLIHATGEGLVNLSERENAGAFGDWSPETDSFVLASVVDQGISLYVTDPAGNAHQLLTDGSYPAGGPSWSPNGQQVVFMAMQAPEDPIDIFLIDSSGEGTPTNLTQSPTDDSFPFWSPDGSKIAFLSDRDGNVEIYSMDVDGSNPANLTNNPANDAIQAEFAWSPDGSQILFHSDRDGNVEIYVMNADGSNQVNLTQSPGTDFGGIWVK